MSDNEKKRAKSEVCQGLMVMFASMAGSEKARTLKVLGVADKDIERLERLSYRDIALMNDSRFGQVDVQAFINAVLRKPIPPELKEFLEYGACNEMMHHYFKITAAQCREWREDIITLPHFRTRTIPIKQHAAVAMALNNGKIEGGIESISHRTMLEIAKIHQVSLRALWNQMKEWDSHE
jgi:pyrrolidone-carboxylate peptidase